MSSLSNLAGRRVTCVTSTGGTHTGVLQGFDSLQNVFLSDVTSSKWEACSDRAALGERSKEVFIRGDNVMYIDITG